MLSFILRLVATQLIKKNFDYVQSRCKRGGKYLYSRFYTKKNERTYPILEVEPRVKSNSF